MVNEVKGTKKNKTVTIRMDERTDKVLGILGSLDLESVPNNSKGEMVTVLIKSIANQILEGKPTFLCRTQELKQILNKKGFDENTFTVITDDDEFKFFTILFFLFLASSCFRFYAFVFRYFISVYEKHCFI